MQGPIVNRTLAAPSPPPARRGALAKVGLALAFGAAVGGVAYGYIRCEQAYIEHHAPGEVQALVTLDDGAVLAVEIVTTTHRDKVLPTSQRTQHERHHARLRRYDQATGKDQARRMVGGTPECVAAAGGRAWCRWEGRVRLLDAHLEDVSDQVAEGYEIERLESDRTGGLLLMGLDGVPARLDSQTLAITPVEATAAAAPRLPRNAVIPVAMTHGASFGLAPVKGQKRVAISRTDARGTTTLEPRRTYLADGFLVDTNGHALNVPAALFLVHRATVKDDAPRKLTRLDHAGRPVWTVDLPEPVDSANLRDDAIVLMGRTRSVAVAIADGAQRWSTPHQP